MSTTEDLLRRKRTEERTEEIDYALATDEAPIALEETLTEISVDTTSQPTTSVLSSLARGLKAEDFVFGEVIGEGTQAQVSLAEYRGTAIASSEVIIKTYLRTGQKGSQRSKELAARVYDELRELKDIGHPALPEVYGLFETTDAKSHVQQNLVMESIHGEPFTNKINPEIEPASSIYWVKQLLDFVEHMQSLGKAHRDLKLENIIIENDAGRLRVLDAGGVTSDIRATLGSTLMEKGSVFGSLKYMAPEQVNGNTKPNSDIYSIGLMLYELLAGEEVEGAVCATHNNLDFTKLEKKIIERTGSARFASSITKIVDSMTKEDYNERAKTAIELREKLAEVEIHLRYGPEVKKEEISDITIIPQDALEEKTAGTYQGKEHLSRIHSTHKILTTYLKGPFRDSHKIERIQDYLTSEKDLNADQKMMVKETIRLLKEEKEIPEILRFTNNFKSSYRALGFNLSELRQMSETITGRSIGTNFEGNSTGEEFQRRNVDLFVENCHELLAYAQKQGVSAETLNETFHILKTKSKATFTGFDKEKYTVNLKKAKKGELKDLEERITADSHSLDKRSLALAATLEDEGFRFDYKNSEENDHVRYNGKMASDTKAPDERDFRASKQNLLNGSIAIIAGSLWASMPSVDLSDVIVSLVVSPIGYGILKLGHRNDYQGQIERHYAPKNIANALLETYQAVGTDIKGTLEEVADVSLSPYQILERVKEKVRERKTEPSERQENRYSVSESYTISERLVRLKNAMWDHELLSPEEYQIEMSRRNEPVRVEEPSRYDNSLSNIVRGVGTPEIDNIITNEIGVGDYKNLNEGYNRESIIYLGSKNTPLNISKINKLKNDSSLIKLNKKI
ncbi:protein kinase [Candidatus Woesearchaeota archaeon]|nr:protein kinase [Candidatus Woesearchaeota archaeon]